MGPEALGGGADRMGTSLANEGLLAEKGPPRTPTDNASWESWMARLNCERLYEADTAEMTPDEVEAMIDRFIDRSNNDRLHQGLQFVTPADRHEGRRTAILAARKEGMGRARQIRRMMAYGGTGEIR